MSACTKVPFSRCNTRFARRAAFGSWVTMMIVVPMVGVQRSSRSRISWALFASRFPGRLVGQQQDRGVGGQRPGDRDALLLPAGELAWIVIHPVGQTHDRERSLRRAPAAARRFRCVSSSGSSTFSCAVNTGIRLYIWKMKPRCSLRHFESRPSDSSPRSCPLTITWPVVGRSSPAHEVQESGLARPRRDHNRHEVSLGNPQRRVRQYRDLDLVAQNSLLTFTNSTTTSLGSSDMTSPHWIQSAWLGVRVPPIPANGFNRTKKRFFLKMFRSTPPGSGEIFRFFVHSAVCT